MLLQLFIELVGCIYRNGFTSFTLDRKLVDPIHVSIGFADALSDHALSSIELSNSIVD